MKKQLKILGFIMLFALLITQVYGQRNKKKNECEFEYQKTDAFTGEFSQMIKVRNHNMYNVMAFWQLQFNKIGNNYDITIITSLNYLEPVQKGDSIIFRLVSDVDSTNSYLTLYACEASNPVRFAVGNGTQAVEYGEYKIKCIVTEEILKQFINSTAKAIRIAIKQNVDKEVYDNKAIEIKKAAECIMK